MATHSSILAWKIPWTEEPSRLQFMESQRVGHDWVTSLHFNPPNMLAALATSCHWFYFNKYQVVPEYLCVRELKPLPVTFIFSSLFQLSQIGRLWGKGNWKRRYLPCSKVFNIYNYWSSNGKAINPFQLILSVNLKKFIEKYKNRHRNKNSWNFFNLIQIWQWIFALKTLGLICLKRS